MTLKKPAEGPPYVSLLEAIRVVVRLMSNGKRLAEFMTDAWIKEGYHRWQSERYDDDPIMFSLYGSDWREWRPKTLAAYGAACGILEKVLRRENITGEGVSCTEPENGSRPITKKEWSTLQIELKRNLLVTPLHAQLSDRPAIRDVQVRVEDLKRECRAEVKALPAAIRPPKSNTGPKSYKLSRTIEAMLLGLQEGVDYSTWKQESLADEFDASRETCVKALRIAKARLAATGKF
jgi:hypothetical protein